MRRAHLALLHIPEKVRAVPLERRVHVRAGIRPLDDLSVAVQVKLATEGAELVVAEVLIRIVSQQIKL